MLGVGGDAAIDSDDPLALMLLAARVRRAREFQLALFDALAVRIAQRVGELFSAD